MIFLGLDISTSNIGYSLVSHHHNETKLLIANFIPISNISGLYDKAAYTRDTLIKACENYKIDAIIVEESLKSFTKRKTSPSVLALLNRFNGIVSYIVRDTFKVPVHFVNSNLARKKVGINIDKEKDTKEQIFEWVKAREFMKDYSWPTKVIKSGKRKGQTVYVSGCYDISDSLVMSLWGCIHLNTCDLDYTIC